MGHASFRVAVFRALKIGDMLCAVPALRSLRAGFPDASIELIGLPWAGEFAHRFSHLVDEFHEFPGFPGLPEIAPRLDQIPSFFASMQARRFDLAIQLHGSGSLVNSLVALLDARRSAGFYLPADYAPDVDGFIPYPDRGLEIRRLLQLPAHLGCPFMGEQLEFPIGKEDREKLTAVTGPLTPERTRACVHVGASVPERRWPIERFGLIATELVERGLEVFLTGSQGESSLAEIASRASGAINLAGKTDLGSLAALVQVSDLVVCNDTSMSHIAAALKRPSVVLSTGRNPERWAPIDHRRHRVLCDDAGVSTEDALEQIDDLLSTFTLERKEPSCVLRAS